MTSIRDLRRLLDLAFAEFHVLAHDGVVLLHDQLVGLGAGVLLGDVEEAGVRRRIQADLDGGGVRHGGSLRSGAGRAIPGGRAYRDVRRGPEKTKPPPKGQARQRKESYRLSRAIA